MKTTHPVTRAALGVAALVTIAILANWLVALTPLGNRGADFTEKQIHTLSDGTKAILAELDTPVVVRYYATRNTDYMPEEMKLYMRRVDDLLKEYASLSNGKLRIENLDPQPDTDAEDSANLDGINGQRFDDQNLYFGLAVNCLDKTTVIPFLDPRDETMLEYHLSTAIDDVTTPVKPKIGIMSELNIAGGPATMPGQQPSQPWIIYGQLQQSFTLENIPMTTESIDPDEIKALLLFHPANITEQAEFAIDQYLLKGGTVIAALDAHSAVARATGGGNPMMGMQGIPLNSNLPNLLKAWGVTFDPDQTLADPGLASQISRTESSIAVLTFGKDNMPVKDSVITRDLESMTFYLPGGFTIDPTPGITTDSLVRTTSKAGLVDSMRAASMDPTLATAFRSAGKPFDVVARLSGNFESAFPDGLPGDEPTDADEAKESEESDGDKPADPPSHLTEAQSPGNVFLIADVDAFYDQIAYRTIEFGGMPVATPVNGNSSLLLNLLDQAIGSKHLIGSRSRSATRRPFTVIQDMEAEFNEKVGRKIDELREKEQAAQTRLNELQAQKTNSRDLFLSPAQEAEIAKLREQQVEYAKLIREQQKELRSRKDKLAGTITLFNVAAMPAIVILVGLGLFAARRRATRAR
ncbi:MAG: Gldg family protein [Verrucomicrobiales bacterium]|nr:Gldg family protein [Verrucomicrobiota bacterium JB025]